MYFSHIYMRNMIPKKEITKKTTPEECPNCKENVLVYGKVVEKKIGDKTIKFCSLACANAYKETGTKREEVEGTGRTKPKGSWLPTK